MTIATAFAAVLIAKDVALGVTRSVEDRADTANCPATLYKGGPTGGFFGTDNQSNGEIHE